MLHCTALAMASGGSCAESVAEEAVRPPYRRPQQPPEQEYDFVEEPAREFFCAVSLELLREPQQTDCCGHHLSLEVTQRLQREGKPCPMCQHPHFTARPDKFHKRKVQLLTVRCPHKKTGCVWVGEVGNLEDHVIKCPKRPWQCAYCAFRGLREVEKDHLSGCGRFPVPCPNGCEAGSVERCSLEQHLSECPLQLVGCEYAAMGCAVRLPRREMSEHIRQSGQEHLLKMSLNNLTLSRELSRKVEEKDQQITELQEEMKRMEGRMEERMKEMEERMRDRMRELEGREKEEIGEMEGRMKERMKGMERRAVEEKVEVEKRVEERVKQVERRMEERVRELAVKKKEKKGLPADVPIAIPPVEYTIPNVSALKAQNKEWRSPPFYSHPGGYKMCIGVWPNGVLRFKGSYVSVMFYTMRDANTEGLMWPANFEIEISILNQISGRWEGKYSVKDLCQDKPFSDSVLRHWHLCYFSHSGQQNCYRDDCYGHNYRDSEGYLFHQCSYEELAPYLKDDCLRIRVTLS